jgi:hypothetical protein
MAEEHDEIYMSWNIIILPQLDGTMFSRHIGLTLEGASMILKQVLADYEKELNEKAEKGDAAVQESPI